MENKKINITEVLKYCPIGMELYSPIFGNVYLDKIRPHLAIVVTTDKEQGNIKEEFLYDGRYGMNGECMLFPSKDKTTWEGFIPPFKDGDILYIDCSSDECTYEHNKYIFILKEISDNKIYCYCYIDEVNKYKKFGISWLSDMTYTPRFATEEEKKKLFDAIRENGYRWNSETKNLELIVPKFKVGDRVVTKGSGLKVPVLITNIVGEFYYYDKYGNGDTIEFFTIKEQDNWELVSDEIEPKFKVGDVVQDKDGYKAEITEVNIGDECYVYLSKLLNWKGSISFNGQDKWELVPDKIEPKFKVGDRVKHKQSFISGTITNIDDDCYKIKYDSGAVSFANIKYQDDWKLVSDEIEPKFKVGDKIRLKGNLIYTITGIRENKSGCGVTFDLRFSEQDKKRELVPYKFDISTLKPFESRVLVRHTKDEIWKPAIFGCYNGYRYYVLGNVHWVYCIPYEGNEHLCGKIDDCDEYYKTWEL